MAEFKIDDPVLNTIKIIKDLTGPSIKIAHDKLKIIGIDGDSSFKTALQSKLQTSTNIDSNTKNYFLSNNGYVSDSRAKIILAEAEASKAKGKVKKITSEMKTMVSSQHQDLLDFLK